MGKYLQLLDRAALHERRRDKSDKSDESPLRTMDQSTFGRLYRFCRNPDPTIVGDITQEERAAIAEYNGGAPRAWAEALAQLDPANPPVDVPLARWQRFIEDCESFHRLGWANLAEAFGWGPLDLFGCDRERPLARCDHMGLLWLIQGRKLVALTANTAKIDTLTGSLQTYRRVPIGSDRIVLAWELAS
jgi:hypothetical protein